MIIYVILLNFSCEIFANLRILCIDNLNWCFAVVYRRGDYMEDIKKKKWKKRLIIFFSICILLLLSVRIQSWYVRKEFEGLKDIAYLLDCDFEWKEYNCYIINGFGCEEVMGADYYVVTPVGGFFWEWVGFSRLDNKELGFPRSIWYDISYPNTFVYPTKEIKLEEIEPNDRDRILNYSRNRERSFNKRCSLSEVEREFDFDTIRCLWVDTYGETDISQFEYFKGSADAENCAYVIPCQGYHSFQSAAEHFCDVLNKYKDKQYLKTGKYLHKVKTGIKKEGEITLDNLVIIGAGFEYDFKGKSSIIRDVEAEAKEEE